MEVIDIPKVIVFHYTDEGRLPEASEEELKELEEAVSKELEKYPDVKFNGTFVNEGGWESATGRLLTPTL